MMTPSSPEKARLLARALRDFVRREDTELADPDAYFAAEQEFFAWMRQAGLDNMAPEFVWHYLTDGDIRRKDAVYAAFQRKEMAELIECLERGEIPEG